MKKNMILVLVCLLQALATQAQSVFDAGNKLFKENKFEAAAQAYEKQIGTGRVSAELFLNCGNAYYKANQLGKAILMYEKAAKLSPYDDDVQANLTIANKKTLDKVEHAPDFVLTKMWNLFCLKYTADAWAIMSVVSFILSLAIVFFIIQTKNNINLYSILTLVLIGFSVLFYFCGNTNNKQLNGNSNGIILTSTVNIKSAPEQNSKALFVLHEGTKVQVLSEENNWVNIKLPNGNEGWIETGMIGMI